MSHPIAAVSELAATGADPSVFLLVAVGAGLVLLGGAAALVMRRRAAARTEEEEPQPVEESSGS
ncbi:MAG: hypothetical protein Q4E05_01345 [Pseudoclavibacter sp.]|nr:hypothetical protein [Pseudoclavibacter sp.]